MSTGGIALLLNQTPHQFTGLRTIGKIVFIFNLVIYLFICTSLTIRFVSNRSALWESFHDPNEAYFVGTFALASATVIMGISLYGTPSCGPWLHVVLRVLYWIYVGVACVLAIGLNVYIFDIQIGQRQEFALVRLLPYFPAMLSGTTASVLAPHQSPDQAIPMIIAGVTLQGLGFMVSLFIYAEYFYDLNCSGLPRPAVRPQMFIGVGPISFTAVALMALARVAQEKFPVHYINAAKTVNTADVVLIIAVFTSVFMWTLAFFFFAISALSLLACYRSLKFSMLWWGCVFPNTGLVLATVHIGRELGSPAILWVTSAMTIFQVVVWLAVGIATIWAVATRRVLWPVEKQN